MTSKAATANEPAAAAPIVLAQSERQKARGKGAERELTRTGADGRTRTRRSSVERDGNGYQRSDTWTDANGREVNREAEGRWDRESETWRRKATTTGPNGGTASVDAETRRTDSGYEHSSTRTRGDRTWQREGSGNYDPETKTWRRNATTTGPDGQTRNVAKEVRRTDDGVVTREVWTNPDGEQVIRETTGRWDPETKTWRNDVSVTGRDGATRTRRTQVSRTDNGFDRTSTVTDADGRSATRDSSGRWDPETRTWQRNAVTVGRDGETRAVDVETQRTDDGYERDVTRTGADGRTSQRRARGRWDPETRTWTRDATITGPDGETLTESATTEFKDD
ncbi:MAG: hypothetical protein AAFM91_02250 [Pseudomonadota bacterium]